MNPINEFFETYFAIIFTEKDTEFSPFPQKGNVENSIAPIPFPLMGCNTKEISEIRLPKYVLEFCLLKFKLKLTNVSYIFFGKYIFI